MKEGIYNEAFEEAKQVYGEIKNEVIGMFKGTRPFDAEQLDFPKLEADYDALAMQPNRFEIVGNLIETYGMKQVNDLFYNIEKFKRRK